MGGGGGTAIAHRRDAGAAGRLSQADGLSTLARRTGAYVGVSDVTMMPAVVDIAGINRLSARILATPPAPSPGW